MTAPAHEEMVEAVAAAIIDRMFEPHELPLTDPWLIGKYRGTARVAIATGFERLKVVTPEMTAAVMATAPGTIHAAVLTRDWLAMLAASPLTPGDGE